MSISRRTLLTTLAAAPFASLLPRPAFAAYPDKPIRLIVPFAAGGNADLVARLVAEGMSPSLGQTIVVETRAGAGGSLGAAAVATAPPDGYTLLTGSNGPLTVNPFVQAKLSYDPLKDFVAVGLANLAPHAIVLHNSVQAKTVAELVALSKQTADHARHLRRRQRLAPDAGALQRRDRREPRACAVSRRRRADPRRARGHRVRRDDRGVDAAASITTRARSAFSRSPRTSGRRKMPDVPTMIESGREGLHRRELRRRAGAGQDAARGRRHAGEGAGQGAGRQGHPGQVHRQRRGARAGGAADLEGLRATTSRRSSRTRRRRRRSPGSSRSSRRVALFDAGGFSRTLLHLACSAAMNCANCGRRRALHHRADLAQPLADHRLRRASR